GLGQAAHPRHHLAGGDRAAGPAPLGDDAEGAAVVAAVLDLDPGAGVVAQAVDQPAVVAAPGAEAGLVAVGDDPVDAGQGAEGLGVDLGGAAGDQDGGVRPLAVGAADGLARLAHGLAGDGAGVDHHRVGQPVGPRAGAHDLALPGVQPAAEGDDLDAHPS